MDPSKANVVVDVSHHNVDVDFAALKQAGIVGIIHKATEGLTVVDGTYQSHRAAALAQGLLWGAYHFGTANDGTQQADKFLSTVGDTQGVLLALDFERGGSMTLDQARAFVTRVQEKTDRTPGFYSGEYVKSLLGSASDDVLGACWFWLAQYGPVPVVPANWSTWRFWQYTDGSVGPEPVAVDGLSARFDRDLFNGSVDDLRNQWAT